MHMVFNIIFMCAEVIVQSHRACRYTRATCITPKANQQAGLTIQEAADFLFLVAMPTTHRSAAISLSSAEECAEQRYLAFKGGSAEKHRASRWSRWAWWRRWVRTEGGDLFSVFLLKVRHLGLEGGARQELIERQFHEVCICSRLLCTMWSLYHLKQVMGISSSCSMWLVLLVNRRIWT